MEIKKTIYDFSKLNHFSPEMKILIVNAQELINDAKSKMKDSDYHFDLTSKIQLKSDYKEVEKYIRLIEKGKLNEANKKNLESAIIRLRTTIDGLVNFYTR